MPNQLSNGTHKSNNGSEYSTPAGLIEIFRYIKCHEKIR
jgi:hypothetical protein